MRFVLLHGFALKTAFWFLFGAASLAVATRRVETRAPSVPPPPRPYALPARAAVAVLAAQRARTGVCPPQRPPL